MSPYKVAHLSSAHSRFDTRIFFKECTSLATHGYDVSLILADGNGHEVRSNVVEMKRLIMLNAIGVVAEDNTVSGFWSAVSSLDRDRLKECRINVVKTRSIYTWEAQEIILRKSYKNIRLRGLQEAED